MLTLTIDNVFRVGVQGLTKKQFASYEKKLGKALADFTVRGQGFHTVIDDKSTVRQIEAYANSVAGKFSDIVVLGIGGSALGAICLRDALTHLYGKRDKKTPVLHVVDNIDPTMIRELTEVLPLKKTLFIVISKSGTTPETMAPYLYFRALLEKAKCSIKKHMVFVTDAERGVLREIAWEEGITTFDIPGNVGGRFSVLTTVGLLPAALIGINIKALLKGARIMRDVFLSHDFTTNTPFQFAALQHALDTKKGKSITVMMPYAQKLKSFADWYRQLLAESIGKKVNRKGKLVEVGITPVAALGTTDQHSQTQLYNEGPHDKLLVFIHADSLGKPLPIFTKKDLKAGISYLRGVSFNTLMEVEYEATREAYTKHSRPNVTISIDEVNETALGELFLFFEGATAFLGELYGVDAFDQPGVELSKVLTKEYLTQRT